MGREKNEQVFSGPLYCCVLTEKLERNKENTYRSNFSGVIFSLPRRHFSHWSRLITTNMPMLISLFFLCFFFFNCLNFIFLFISLFSVREASGWAHDLWYFQLTTTNKSKTMWLLLRKTHTHTHTYRARPNEKPTPKRPNTIFNFVCCSSPWLALKTQHNKQHFRVQLLRRWWIAATQREAATLKIDIKI